MGKQVRVEVTVISAQDLKSGKGGCIWGKMIPYVVMWTTSTVANFDRKTTSPSTKGGRHPTWNFKQTLYSVEDSVTKEMGNLTIELRHRSFMKEKLLGTVKVPLAAGYRSDTPKPLTNEVVLPNGKNQGILNFSPKISDVPAYDPPPPPPTPKTTPSVGGGAGVAVAAATCGGGDPGDGGGGCGGSSGGCGGGCGE